ncbi:MAG: hypothetical protein KDD40_08060, partial [Bdellovibrionales bacterium]|nr:hypothetical protein [Bdellovibrionales bacterium]
MKKSILILMSTLMLSGFSASVAVADDGAGAFFKLIGSLIDDSDHDRGRGRHDRDDYRRRERRHLECVANDEGWEEHWGGHGSCRECLRKHGDCIETCYSTFVQCKAEGRSRYGYRDEFKAEGQRRYLVEDRAIERCRRAGYQECRSKGCTTEKEIESRRSCGRRGRR